MGFGGHAKDAVRHWEVWRTATETGTRFDPAIWSLTMAVMAAITAIALYTPLNNALFPELSALTLGLLSFPRGRWAQSPWTVAVAPAGAGAIGVALARAFGFNAASVAASIAGTLLLLWLLRSAVTPALSAGLLALVLGLTTYLYPLAIFVGGLIIVAVHYVYSRRQPGVVTEPAPVVQATGHALSALALLLFGAAVAALAGLVDVRFLLFPPLIVLTHELLDNSACPWSGQPLLMAVGCLLTAASGVAVHALLGTSVVGVALTVGVGLVVLRGVRLFMPPALSVGLLPFVMPDPGWTFPLAVLAGTALAAGYMAACGRVSEWHAWRTIRRRAESAP